VKRVAIATVVAVLGAGAAVPGRAPAQAPPGAGVSAGASAVWEESTVGTAVIRRTGVLLDGRARASVWRLDLDLGYRQGSLSAASVANQRTLVEGDAMLGVRLTRWIKLEGGPRVRAYVTPTATERWLMWEGRARLAAHVRGPSVQSYVVLARAFSANLRPALPFGQAQSGEAGISVRLGRSPLWSQVGYWISQASVSGGQRVETLQGLSVKVVLSPK